MEDRTIREVAIAELYHVVDDYCTWYVEQGLYLPPDYATDPSGWNEVINQIKRAFTLMHDYSAETGELWKAKGNEEMTAKLEKEVQEGFTLFGKYLFFLNDVVNDRGPAHG